MKVATIGTGMIVDWFLSAATQNQVIPAAMYSRKRENAAKLAEAYGVQDIYTDLDEMLKRADIDFIYVASPNSLHYEYTMKAMKAGKHVICEKPFASTVKEFKELKAYANKHSLFLFEAIVTAHMPNYLRIKKELPRLGQIRMVQCNFSQYSSRYDKLLAGEIANVFNPQFSGGALGDIGIYNLHYVVGLFGKPDGLHYFPNKHPNGIDTSGVSVLEYPGFKAVCIGAKDTRSQCIAQIQGEKGYITMQSETSKCANVTITIDGKSEDLSIVQNEISLYYEVKDFKQYFEEHNLEKCYELLDYSEDVMEVYERLRKDGEIIFPADQK